MKNKDGKKTDPELSRKDIIKAYMASINEDFSVLVSVKTGSTFLNQYGPCRIADYETGNIIAFDDSKLVLAAIGSPSKLLCELQTRHLYKQGLMSELPFTGIVREFQIFNDSLAATSPDLVEDDVFGNNAFKSKAELVAAIDKVVQTLVTLRNDYGTEEAA